MRNIFFYLLIFIITSTLIAENQAGSLVMVRCDNGNNGFLSSPQQIQLNSLQSSFNANADTVILIHGFKTTYSTAKSCYEIAHRNLKSQLGNINYVGFYWPADFLVDFGKGVKHANTTRRYLSHVLMKINGWYGGNGRKIHLIGHSLGTRVILGTLKSNEVRYLALGQCTLFAPAVHNNIYFTEFSNTHNKANKNWVYYSKNDWVLKYLYSLWYWLFGERDKWENLPGAEKFTPLSLDEKFKYMRQLEENAKRIDFTMPSEFDRQLYLKIKEAEKNAMGLVGADLGSPKSIFKVSNIDVSNTVDGHSYWENAQVLKMTAQKIKQ